MLYYKSTGSGLSKNVSGFPVWLTVAKETCGKDGAITILRALKMSHLSFGCTWLQTNCLGTMLWRAVGPMWVQGGWFVPWMAFRGVIGAAEGVEGPKGPLGKGVGGSGRGLRNSFFGGFTLYYPPFHVNRCPSSQQEAALATILKQPWPLYYTSPPYTWTGDPQPGKTQVWPLYYRSSLYTWSNDPQPGRNSFDHYAILAPLPHFLPRVPPVYINLAQNHFFSRQ